MTTLVVLSVIDIVLLIAGLAVYLWIVGGQLGGVADHLEECRDLVRTIVANAEPIVPGVAHVNRTGGVVAGALPLLYGMAEGIVSGATYQPAEPAADASRPRPPATPASGTRRTRLGEAVGYEPESSGVA
jgi:hypothetical protein